MDSFYYVLNLNSISIQSAKLIFIIFKQINSSNCINFLKYINNKRILNSLNGYKSNTTILRIALLNGYNSIEYYSEIFRNLVGVSPRVYKRFITPLNNLNEEETNTIRNSISNLINIENKIQKYLSNQKPKELPVRKLSIFK